MNQPVNAPKPPFKLEVSDRQSVTWARLSSYCDDRLATLRAQNDADMSEVETAKLRGRIAEVKAMLALAKDNPIPPPG